MWELICHHTYDWHGLAIDRSPYGSDGRAVGNVQFLPDGVGPGSGAARFDGNCEIRIPLNPGWAPLRGVRVECTIRRLAETHSEQTLIYCNGFDFQIGGGGHFLSAGVFHDDNDDRISSFWLDGPDEAPLNEWVTLGFEHDGLSIMRLLANGQERMAERPKGTIPSADSFGIYIGRSPNERDQFVGDIDEIKVWRRNPRAMWNDFARRPVDDAAAQCWYEFLKRIDEYLQARPECARLLSGRLIGLVERLARQIVTHDPAAMQQFRGICQDYRRHWRAGTLDNPAMSGLLADFLLWLQSLGIDARTDPEFVELVGSDCFRALIQSVPGLSCDEKFAGLYGEVIRAVDDPKRSQGI